MKISGLRKLAGSVVRVRPPVRRLEVGPTGAPSRLLPIIDYDWMVKRPSDPRATVELHCLPTGHFVELGSDGVYEFRYPNFLILKFQLTLTNDRRVLKEPLPDPRTRYARSRRRIRRRGR